MIGKHAKCLIQCIQRKVLKRRTTMPRRKKIDSVDDLQEKLETIVIGDAPVRKSEPNQSHYKSWQEIIDSEGTIGNILMIERGSLVFLFVYENGKATYQEVIERQFKHACTSAVHDFCRSGPQCQYQESGTCRYGRNHNANIFNDLCSKMKYPTLEQNHDWQACEVSNPAHLPHYHSIFLLEKKYDPNSAEARELTCPLDGDQFLFNYTDQNTVGL
ncbi:unnamed protein product [Didymodactylos carnosus]|uniref:Uncharacterized protein n=1 Tax=Didymodactylos carnosus TaxID=1234261 RepID=A0A815RQ37_9BILA|nr:unnamed protein product [Didymodactylos carnosus]CAF4344259.1 unnamed protein product [Didymodactylos carnosus]